ncbi:MAG: hypothetical protein R3185_01070 [Candidatus Thermoplasmatota archaeon]|nr:hypothetical protein [Candidatus Thermoplasmatota archaeon]
MDPKAWKLIPLLALLLLQPVLPLAHAHGNDDGHGEATPSSNEGGFGPQAQQLTPLARYVEQAHPAIHGDMAVWQERRVGRSWDIVAYNLSTGGPAFPVTLDSNTQTNPAIRGPWIAWEDHNGQNKDIKVLNLETGEQIRVPDTGGPDIGPTIGERAVYWMRGDDRGLGQLYGYDLLAREMIRPAGNNTIVSPPTTYKSFLAWAEGDKVAAKVRVMDTSTGERWSVPDLWAVADGPELSGWGVSFVADVRGAQTGVYTTVYNWTQDTFTPQRTGKYPHRQLAACDTGMVWNQFEVDSKLPTVAIWDGFTEKIGDFGYNNANGACWGDHLIYEKTVPAEDEDLPDTTRIYHIDLRSTRAPVRAKALLDPGFENGIFEDRTIFTGRVIPGDPREEITGIWGTVDGGEFRRLSFEKVPGGYAWQMVVDPSRYFNGQHTLNLVTMDARGTRTDAGFRFFTTGVYQTDQSVFGQGLNVPREEPSPFPFNLIDHYHDFRAFYNTVFLALAIIIAIAWMVIRYLRSRPKGRPEFVRPDEGEADEPPPSELPPPPPPPKKVTFQRL